MPNGRCGTVLVKDLQPGPKACTAHAVTEVTVPSASAAEQPCSRKAYKTEQSPRSCAGEVIARRRLLFVRCRHAAHGPEWTFITQECGIQRSTDAIKK